MAYEYTNGLGRRVMTVYGTLPEAQEYVAEEYGLPYPVPAVRLLPPFNQKRGCRTVSFIGPWKKRFSRRSPNWTRA